MERSRGFEIAKGWEDKDIHMPVRKTARSAGYDVEAAEDTVIPPFQNGCKPTLIHTGLNIISEGAPVKAAGLQSELGIKDIKEFAYTVMKRYADELEDINLAATKVRGV